MYHQCLVLVYYPNLPFNCSVLVRQQIWCLKWCHHKVCINFSVHLLCNKRTSTSPFVLFYKSEPFYVVWSINFRSGINNWHYSSQDRTSVLGWCKIAPAFLFVSLKPYLASLGCNVCCYLCSFHCIRISQISYVRQCATSNTATETFRMLKCSFRVEILSRTQTMDLFS